MSTGTHLMCGSRFTAYKPKTYQFSARRVAQQTARAAGPSIGPPAECVEGEPR